MPWCACSSWLSWKFPQTVFWWEPPWDCHRIWTNVWALSLMFALLRASFPTPEVRSRRSAPVKDKSESQSKNKEKHPCFTQPWNYVYYKLNQGHGSVLTLEPLWENIPLFSHIRRWEAVSMPCRCQPAARLLRERLKTAENKTQAWRKVRGTQAQRGPADNLRLSSWGQKTQW